MDGAIFCNLQIVVTIFSSEFMFTWFYETILEMIAKNLKLDYKGYFVVIVAWLVVQFSCRGGGEKKEDH